MSQTEQINRMDYLLSWAFSVLSPLSPISSSRGPQAVRLKISVPVPQIRIFTSGSMNRIVGTVTSFFRRPELPGKWSPTETMLGAIRGIRVRVRNGNLEQALAIMNRKMQSSGMERLLKRARLQERHLKNSEKRVLARKNLERRIRAQEFHKKLRQALVNKLRSNLGFSSFCFVLCADYCSVVIMLGTSFSFSFCAT